MKPPDFEDEATLYSLSSEYFEAATIIYNTPPTKINCSAVIYYLLGHASELLLKSFLHKKGVPIPALRNKFCHDLSKLAKEARKYNLSSKVNLDNIVVLSSTYKYKKLEYRKKTAEQYPSIECLLIDIQELQNCVFENVADFDT
jgi:hypothetical protein